MPRMPAKIRRRYREGMEILDAEIEESFLRGEGLLGTPPELRTLEDWQTHWGRWRDVVMPKAIEHQPGLRPFACYVCGEIEPPPLLRPVPLTASFFKLYIPSTRGDGQWHHRYPEPYQRDETLHLRDLGVVDDAELKRHRAWRRDGKPFTYVFEQGSYE